MARLTRDHHLDAALQLILGSFKSAQGQGRLTNAEIAGTFLVLYDSGNERYHSRFPNTLPGEPWVSRSPRDRRSPIMPVDLFDRFQRVIHCDRRIRGNPGHHHLAIGKHTAFCHDTGA